QAAPVLLAGNALHSDLPPEAAGSAVYGWLLCMLGQRFGFPVPVGGAGALTQAMAKRFRARGGQLRTSAPAIGLEIAGGAVRAVRLASGERLAARRAVIADVPAPVLYEQLIGADRLPPRVVADIQRFQWDAPTLKVDWALSSRIPWTNRQVAEAGTVHLGVDLDGLTRYTADLAMRRPPAEPFVLLGQMTTADASRSPAGTESVWAYTHLPHGMEPDTDAIAEQVARVEALLERHAPGFAGLVLGRKVQAPGDLVEENPSLQHGAINGGTAQLHQQLIFRPIPGLGGASTPIDRLYLGSSSAHPGGGVHGACGANAAIAALKRAGRLGGPRRRLMELAMRQLYR
ncbi:MAG TPA: NAD(P)/FAD-dependent oxidoreductase, partial [Jatrophihabitans sp.]|nr:NAD(P)/FAD-dependent oxidoreductase [Jatrophihabitans sp.]